MNSRDYLYILFSNVYFEILCIVIGVYLLRYILKKGIKLPENRLILRDLDTFYISILLILFGIVLIIVKFTK